MLKILILKVIYLLLIFDVQFIDFPIDFIFEMKSIQNIDFKSISIVKNNIEHRDTHSEIHTEKHRQRNTDREIHTERHTHSTVIHAERQVQTDTFTKIAQRNAEIHKESHRERERDTQRDIQRRVRREMRTGRHALRDDHDISHPEVAQWIRPILLPLEGLVVVLLAVVGSVRRPYGVPLFCNANLLWLGAFLSSIDVRDQKHRCWFDGVFLTLVQKPASLHTHTCTLWTSLTHTHRPWRLFTFSKVSAVACLWTWTFLNRRTCQVFRSFNFCFLIFCKQPKASKSNKDEQIAPTMRPQFRGRPYFKHAGGKHLFLWKC